MSDLSLVCTIEFRVVGRNVAVVTEVREDKINFAIDGGGSVDRGGIEWLIDCN